MSLCVELEWDSNFFGFPIARLQSHCLSAEILRECLSWCRAHRVRCLYFLANSDHQLTVDLAVANGFRLVDLRLTLECRPARLTGGSLRVREWCVSDLATLRRIAGEAHRESRFYYDTNFPRNRVDELYAVWIEKSCQGFADAVFVAERAGEPCGYITCHVASDSTGSIGLVGVAEAARGQGVGSDLVRAALAYFADRGVHKVSVVTQGRNRAAQRLYQKHGFLTSSLQLWFHRWFLDAPRGGENS